jgi:hypothetical protein
MHRYIQSATILVLSSLLAGCSAPGLPDADRCTPGSADGVDSFAIGPGKDSESATDLPTDFRPYVANDNGDFVTGGQGFTMLRVRIRVAGHNPPACLAQQTNVDILNDAQLETVGSDNVPRRTYPQPDGSRLTKPLYIVVDFGPIVYDGQVQISTPVGGKTVSVPLAGFVAPDLGMTVPVDGGRD